MEEYVNNISSNDDDDTFDYYLKTKRNMIPCNIKWEIEDFFLIPYGESLISPEFHPIPEKSCCLKVTKLEKDILVRLCYQSNVDTLIQYRFSISNNKGLLLYQRTGDTIHTDQYDLTDSTIKECYSDLNSLENEKLIFKCYLKIYGAIETRLCSTETETQHGQEVIKNLTEDFKYILENSVNTDVTLVTKDGQISAHKFFLSARSSVFNKMFQHEMNETKNNVVVIDDLQLIVVKRLTSFLYYGEFNWCDCDVDTLCNLYYAADKYDVLDLQRLCGVALLKKLDVDNACQILAFLDCHEDREIKSKVVKFIHLNLCDVVKTAGWNTFMNGRLSAEVIEQIVHVA